MANRWGVLTTVASSVLLLTTVAASATQGYFQHGYGARSKALAGAGVADSTDATAQSTNPAGIVGVGNQLNAAFSLFMPMRDYTGTGTFGFTPLGNVESDENIFVMPNFAISYALDENSSIGFMAIGNGGMNTTYPGMARTLTNGPCLPGTFGTGTYCFGKAGVDLMQMILGITYARRMGNVSFGITPLIGIQRFSARGLTAFGAASNAPTALSDTGNDWAYGAGVRAGIQMDVSDRFRVALSGQSPIFMTKFDKYAGLFANGGDFDVPGSITAGFAYDVTNTVTVMFDYKHIFYEGVDAVSNSSTNILTCVPGAATCLGGSNGPGFGWKDVDVFAIGLEWDATERLTIRAGYAYNTQPVQSADVMFNILAPGVVQHHITGGFKYDITERSSIEFAASYMPVASVSGTELPGFGATTHGIEVSMSQIDLTLGYTYKWGEPQADPEAIVRKY
ncbi:MAG: outer membrane protein transport protein [Hyphomicrobiales bacterium]|nr:outer membrane protein transport protein [Hyphomicrobiales bacterium]